MTRQRCQIPLLGLCHSTERYLKGLCPIVEGGGSRAHFKPPRPPPTPPMCQCWVCVRASRCTCVCVVCVCVRARACGREKILYSSNATQRARNHRQLSLRPVPHLANRDNQGRRSPLNPKVPHPLKGGGGGMGQGLSTDPPPPDPGPIPPEPEMTNYLHPPNWQQHPHPPQTHLQLNERNNPNEEDPPTARTPPAHRPNRLLFSFDPILTN